ncbi:hypothetical protein [Candidatus Neptunochlamydia vexilliferae]|uniref:hypothetical protein n=1 Tax=Candidatus Neptunichlamydia vexilliferae TaxID=1651774 RepID=UPI00189146D0|nr:hypothetical protein [Candidatus Neptunochlamydia vexilliferae]
MNKQDLYAPDMLVEATEEVAQIDLKELSARALETYQSLCGRIYHIGLQNELHALVDEAIELKEGRYASYEELEERALELDILLHELRYNNPFLEREGESKSFIALVQKILAGLKVDVVHHSQTSMEDGMLPESNAKGAVTAPDWEEAEEGLNRLEAARLIHIGRVHEAEILCPGIGVKTPHEIVTEAFKLLGNEPPSKEEALEILEEASSYS